MVEITADPISPEQVIGKVRDSACGCVVTYVGLIRGTSRGKPVRSVEYRDSRREAEARLREIAAEAVGQGGVGRVAITHRIGVLAVGEINLVVAVGAGHRDEGFRACRYVIDQFKQRLPTLKRETYLDGSVYEPG